MKPGIRLRRCVAIGDQHVRLVQIGGSVIKAELDIAVVYLEQQPLGARLQRLVGHLEGSGGAVIALA